jgi:hypothetical protein
MISSQDGTEERRPFAVFLAPARWRFDASSAAGSAAGSAAAAAGADGSGAVAGAETGADIVGMS